MAATARVPSPRRMSAAEARPEPAAPSWRALHLVAGAAALCSVALIVAAIGTHIAWPPPAWAPGPALDWFVRFQENWLLGLLGLDLLIVVGLVLGVPIYLALYLALRQAGETAMLIATAMALLSTVLHLVSNTAFEMLAFSQAYAAATTVAERALLVAAGEATLAAYYGTAFHVSYIMGYAAKIVIGAVMLRGGGFGRATAYVAILAGALGLGLYLPAVGLLCSVLSVVLLAAWNLLLARALIRLAQRPAPEV
ncbi:MAG TPA: hypothetical protein PKD53_18735 [Chloroflexaceae bacterium]|nr:hypothetical protein [Chloroflexaceae bacterium]